MRRLSVITLFLAALTASLAAQQTSAAPPPAPALRGQQGQPPPPPPPAQTQPSGRGSQTPPSAQTLPGGQRGGAGRGAGFPPSEAAAPSRPRTWEPPSQNIKIEVAITDTAERSTRKVVSMLIGDGDGGRIRSTGNQGVLNVDANARAGSDGRIQVSITIEYMPDRAANTTNLNESVTLVLAPGKPTLISQSADPGSERKVTVELTATTVK
jgi:hypothetical protein